MDAPLIVLRKTRRYFDGTVYVADSSRRRTKSPGSRYASITSLTVADFPFVCTNAGWPGVRLP